MSYEMIKNYQKLMLNILFINNLIYRQIILSFKCPSFPLFFTQINNQLTESYL